MTKRILALVFVFSVVAALTACGGTSNSSAGTSNTGSSSSSGSTTGSSDPAAAAKGFYDGLYGSGQIDTFVCTSNATAIDAVKQSVAAFKQQMSAANASIDVSGLTYAAANQSGDAADVKVSGQIKTTVAGNSTSTDFPAVTLKMKNENGWKVCGIGA